MKFPEFEWHPTRNFSRGGIVKHLYLVVHGTGGNLDSSLAWLCNPASSVSAHFLIGKAGKAYQLVDTDDKAWHAGKASTYGGVAGLNSYSIGVELENLDNATDPYTDFQYEKLALLHALLWAAHPTLLKTVGHQDILSTKHDPGPMFDWVKFRAMCMVGAANPPVVPPQSDPFADAVIWAKDQGLILGDPTAWVDRQALAVILKRFHDKFIGGR